MKINFSKHASTSLFLSALLTLQLAGAVRASGPDTHDALRKVASPESVLGFVPGDDNKLDSWADLQKYYEALARTSDRVKLQVVGKSTQGRPFLVAVISSASTIKNLGKYQRLNALLSDPRKLKGGDKEAEDIIQNGKSVVVVTCGIHSSEVASYLAGQLIAYRLASATDDETQRILDNTIVVLVPALNPDGVDIVKGQFDKTLAATTTGRGRSPDGLPQPLFHYYIGHDDNRDWIGFTQVETQLAVDKAINPWHPQILQDIHQQSSNGPRITLPPYTDPVEPNIPKQIVQGYTDLGHAIAADLTAQGFTGVITGAASASGYDAWSPLRQYANFHNGVRMLQETASARIAAPITVDADRVRPNTPLPNFPAPWPGGVWRVGDATRYAVAAAFSLLNNAATNREKWLRTAYEIAKEAVRTRADGETAAYLIPASPNRASLLTILNHGGVEFEYLGKPLTYGGTQYPQGTAVVYLNQPYGGFANAILSIQHYPNLRDASGNPIRPYDVTAHTLPLLLDVPVTAAVAPFKADSRLAGRPKTTPVIFSGRQANPNVRLAVLQSNSIDEGWIRWVLDLHHVHYTLVKSQDIADGKLQGQYDALLLPTPLFAGGRGEGGGDFGGAAERLVQEPSAPAPANGARQGRQGRGAVNPEAQAAQRAAISTQIKQFVENGGTVVGLNRASDSVITALDLPIKDVTQGLSRNEFFVPGSILRTQLDTSNALAKGLPQDSIIWAEGSPAFEIADPADSKIKVVAKYPADSDPLLSGWLLGGEALRGKAALVEVSEGKGRAILFGFKPAYRGLSLATYPLLFNAIDSSAPTK